MKRTALKRTPFKSRNVNARAEAKWRNTVRANGNYQCKRCGKVERHIHAHHVAPRSRRPDLKLDPANGICLCQECHAWTHSHPLDAVKLGLLSNDSYEKARKGAMQAEGITEEDIYQTRFPIHYPETR